MTVRINNRDRVLKAYCAERLKGTRSAGQSAALRAAHAAVVGKVAGHRFISWTAEAEKMCVEEFDSRDFAAKRDRALRNEVSRELLKLHRKAPWHGTLWAQGVRELIAVHGEQFVDEVWRDVQDYLRDSRS